jgi:putative membrane protein
MRDWQCVVIGIAIIAQSSAGFERTPRAIDRDEVMQIPQSRAESLLSAALAVVIGAFTFAARGF